MKMIRRIFRDQFPFAFAVPALAWQVYFLYVPLIVLIASSFVINGTSLSFVHYYGILTRPYFRVFFHSCLLASVTSVAAFLIGYPIAHYLAIKVRRYKTLLLVLIIVPSWTSFIVQVYSWFFLLKKDGVVSSILYNLGILSSRDHLIGTQFAIFIGMIYCYLPFMIFPLFAVLERMDKSLLEVSADLGATRMQTFRRVVFPLSLPGVAAGFLLVFIPAFGEFVIPELLGGGKQAFLGTVIVDKFLFFHEWESGSALVTLGVILPVVAMISCIYLFQRIMRKQNSGANKMQIRKQRVRG